MPKAPIATLDGICKTILSYFPEANIESFTRQKSR